MAAKTKFGVRNEPIIFILIYVRQAQLISQLLLFHITWLILILMSYEMPIFIFRSKIYQPDSSYVGQKLTSSIYILRNSSPNFPKVLVYINLMFSNSMLIKTFSSKLVIFLTNFFFLIMVLSMWKFIGFWSYEVSSVTNSCNPHISWCILCLMKFEVFNICFSNCLHILNYNLLLIF